MTVENRDEAWAELHEPATTATRLAAIAGAYPEFASAAADHSNAYPALREWAAQLGVPSASAVQPMTVQTVSSPNTILPVASPLPTAPHQPGSMPIEPAASPARPTPVTPRTPLAAARTLWIAGFALYLLAAVPFWSSTWWGGMDYLLIAGVTGWVRTAALVLSAVAALVSGAVAARRIVAAAILFLLAGAGSPLILGLLGLEGSLTVVGAMALIAIPAFVAWALAWPIHGAGWAGIAFLALPFIAGFLPLWVYLPVVLPVSQIVAVLCAVLWSRGSARRRAARASADEARAAAGVAPAATVLRIQGAAGAPDTVVTLEGVIGPPAHRTSTLAVVAFIMSFVACLIGAILGHVALSSIRRTGESGRGLAIAAVVIGWCLTAIWIAGAIVYIVLIASIFG